MLASVLLVIYGDIAEQVGHGFSIMDAANGFSQNHADVHRLDLGTLELLDLVGDRVSHHHLRDKNGATITTPQN